MLSPINLVTHLILLNSYLAQCRIYHDSTTRAALPLKTSGHHSHDALGCDDLKSAPRIVPAIVGGTTVTDVTSVPYIAAVGERTRSGVFHWFCGGVLLSNKFVLTAAHCVSRSAHVVRLGGTSLSPNASSFDVAIESTIVHPDYRSPQSYHDLALLRLATNVQISKEIRPICLAKRDAGRRPGEVTSVMGWGAKSVGGLGTSKLKKVDVQIYLNPECDKVYRKNDAARASFPRGVTEQQLCAGSPNGGKDACQGDSGGPLVVEDRNRVIRLVGIVAAGVGCGLKDVPGVYIRVSSYEEWITRYVY